MRRNRTKNFATGGSTDEVEYEFKTYAPQPYEKGKRGTYAAPYTSVVRGSTHTEYRDEYSPHVPIERGRNPERVTRQSFATTTAQKQARADYYARQRLAESREQAKLRGLRGQGRNYLIGTPGQQEYDFGRKDPHDAAKARNFAPMNPGEQPTVYDSNYYIPGMVNPEVAYLRGANDPLGATNAIMKEALEQGKGGFFSPDYSEIIDDYIDENWDRVQGKDWFGVREDGTAHRRSLYALNSAGTGDYTRENYRQYIVDKANQFELTPEEYERSIRSKHNPYYSSTWYRSHRKDDEEEED